MVLEQVKLLVHKKNYLVRQVTFEGRSLTLKGLLELSKIGIG